MAVLSEGDLARVDAGAVMVVRHATAAMLPALIRAAGAVSERGGVLNHLAVLARELGKPCVTGVAGIVDAVESGTAIVVDGTRGVVEVEESCAAAPPVEDVSELVAVMQFGQFGAAFEPRGQRAGVDAAVSVAALASVPAALGLGPALTVEIRDGRVLVRRNRLRAVVAELTDRIEEGLVDAGELRARFERLVSPGDGDALETDLGRYTEAYQLVWAASLAREPLAERYRAFLLGRLANLDDAERERLYLGSLTRPGTSYILRSALDGGETVWGPPAPAPVAQRAVASAAGARERLSELLEPVEERAARRYLGALDALVDLTERKNTDLHRCGRALFAGGAREVAAAALLGLEQVVALPGGTCPAPTAADDPSLAAAIMTLARRLAQNRISTIPGRSEPG